MLKRRPERPKGSKNKPEVAVVKPTIKPGFQPKKCAACERVKNPRQFYIVRGRYLSGYCKDCYKLYQADPGTVVVKKPRTALIAGHNTNNARNNRARKMGVPGEITAEEWKDLLEYYGRRCVYCGTKAFKLQLDHIIPLSKYKKGWLDATNTIDNAVPCCGPCNRAKSDMPLIIFLAWRCGALDETYQGEAYYAAA